MVIDLNILLRNFIESGERIQKKSIDTEVTFGNGLEP